MAWRTPGLRNTLFRSGMHPSCCITRTERSVNTFSGICRICFPPMPLWCSTTPRWCLRACIFSGRPALILRFSVWNLLRRQSIIRLLPLRRRPLGNALSAMPKSGRRVSFPFIIRTVMPMSRPWISVRNSSAGTARPAASVSSGKTVLPSPAFWKGAEPFPSRPI